MTRFVDPPGFAEWEATVSLSMRRRTIWKTPAYRYGLWLSDLVKADARLLSERSEVNTSHVDQLVRAVSGISSNLAEGYACPSGLDRARYYGYALTSTHESFDWYFKVRDALGEPVVEQRWSVLDRIIRILTVTIPQERKRSRRDRSKPPEDPSLGIPSPQHSGRPLS